MATIGHTLAGLSLAGCGPIKARGGVMPHLWPAFVVLLAHAVDLIEWGAALVMDAPADRRFLTHSPVATGILVLLIWVGLALGAKLRRPAPYLIVAAAVFSHLLLDLPSVRVFVTHAYVRRETYGLPPVEQSFVAEIWLLGFVFVLVGLTRTIFQETCPRKGRIAAVALGLATLAAAASRLPAVWIPAYLVSLAHAGVLLRRSFHMRQLWGIVVILPVLAFVGVEATAAHLTAKGLALMRAGREREAIAFYQRVSALPTRESQAWSHVLIGQCYQRLGEPASAEAAFIRGVKASDSPGWPTIYLARFYMQSQWRGSRFFRPAEAKALLEQARARPRDPRILPHTARLLENLKAQGATD